MDGSISWCLCCHCFWQGKGRSSASHCRCDPFCKPDNQNHRPCVFSSVHAPGYGRLCASCRSTCVSACFQSVRLSAYQSIRVDWLSLAKVALCSRLHAHCKSRCAANAALCFSLEPSADSTPKKATLIMIITTVQQLTAQKHLQHLITTYRDQLTPVGFTQWIRKELTTT